MWDICVAAPVTRLLRTGAGRGTAEHAHSLPKYVCSVSTLGLLACMCCGGRGVYKQSLSLKLQAYIVV